VSVILTIVDALTAGRSTVVRIVSADVSGFGRWHGRPVTAGDQVDVELELRMPVDWADIQLPHRLRPLGLAVGPDQTVLQGTALEQDGLDVLTLLVNEQIVLVDTVGRPPAGITGRAVRLMPAGLELYDTNV
jgi:hypothetical protein